MSGCCNLESDNKQFLKCKECGKLGRFVKRITVEHLLKQERISSIQDSQYFFCSTPDCNVVYFSENANFYKVDLKVRVGIKKAEEPIPVCYCFSYTKKMILDDMVQNGYSTIESKIKEAVKKGDCRCALTNPEGTCCLGNVAKITKEVMTDTQIEIDSFNKAVKEAGFTLRNISLHVMGKIEETEEGLILIAAGKNEKFLLFENESLSERFHQGEKIKTLNEDLKKKLLEIKEQGKKIMIEGIVQEHKDYPAGLSIDHLELIE